MKKIFLFLFLVFFLSSCTAKHQRVDIKSPLNKVDYQSHLGSGNNSIEGQAFLRQKSGGVVTCAGNSVFLFPATDFFREVLQIVKSGRKTGKTSVDRRTVQEIIRESKCNTQGGFKFDNLPDGDWIVATDIFWKTGRLRQGGAVSSEIGTNDGHTSEIIMSGIIQ